MSVAKRDSSQLQKGRERNNVQTTGGPVIKEQTMPGSRRANITALAPSLIEDTAKPKCKMHKFQKFIRFWKFWITIELHWFACQLKAHHSSIEFPALKLWRYQCHDEFHRPGRWVSARISDPRPRLDEIDEHVCKFLPIRAKHVSFPLTVQERTTEILHCTTVHVRLERGNWEATRNRRRRDRKINRALWKYSILQLLDMMLIWFKWQQS